LVVVNLSSSHMEEFQESVGMFGEDRWFQIRGRIGERLREVKKVALSLSLYCKLLE